MPDYTLPLLLLTAAMLAAALCLIRLERAVKRSSSLQRPQFPDLTPHFIETHCRIASEAEKTRAEALSHARNTQAAVKTLVGVVGEYAKSGDLHHQVLLQRIEDETTAAIGAIAANIYEDGKKTRQRTAQIKTRLTDDERDDQRTKSQQRRIEAMKQDKKPKASK